MREIAHLLRRQSFGGTPCVRLSLLPETLWAATENEIRIKLRVNEAEIPCYLIVLASAGMHGAQCKCQHKNTNKRFHLAIAEYFI